MTLLTRNSSLPLEDVCGVVVTFNPDAGFCSRVAQVLKHVQAVIVVDNASSAGHRDLIPKAAASTTETLNNPENVGLAAALNQGVNRAIEKGYQWVLTMDQDTIPFDGLGPSLHQALETAPEHGRIGAIGTSYDVVYGRNSSRENTPPVVKPVKTVITAGCLLSARAFERVGGFRENLFIDGVDEDLCLRLRKAGFIILQTSAIGIQQPIGAQTRHRFLWREVGVSNHPVTRHYYMARNRLGLMAAHWRFDPAWSVTQLLVQLKTALFVVLYESCKRRKLLAMARGFADAVRGRMGPICPTHVP